MMNRKGSLCLFRVVVQQLIHDHRNAHLCDFFILFLIICLATMKHSDKPEI